VNEGSAQQSLRTINSAELVYYTTAGNGSYGTIANLQARQLIDTVLNSGVKSGFNFTTGAAPAASTTVWVAAAAPVVSSGVTATGTREFCIDQTGVLGAKLAASQTVATSCAGFTAIGN
jgi:hypothetical protein